MGYLYQDSVNASLGHSATYTYDSLNRLATAVAAPLQTGGAAYNLTFEQTVKGVYSGYDRYGNMTCVNGSTGTFCPQLGYNPATNQLTGGYTYDAAGNLINDSSHSYQYDAEGRLISLDNKSTSSWVYNALGQKVEKTSVIPHSYTYERLYDPQGLLMSFWNTSLSGWGFRYVRLGARAVGFDNNGTNEYFDHLNNLGSVTMVTQYNGSPFSDQQFYPWGDFWTGTNPSDVIWASTTESEGFEGLADTPNRDDSLGLGRWMTPDLLAGDITNPQSLNRYAYALNNPTTLIDPLGLTSLGMSAINCWPGTAGCKVLPSCHGMVCADQYYGGSMYPGFTSADQTTCTIDSVSANCNSAIADLQNGSATLLNITVNNPGAVAGSAGSILVQLPGTCSSVSFGNTSTSGTCWSGSDELVSVPGAGPSFQAANYADPTLDNRANALAQAVSKTGIQSLNPSGQQLKGWAKSYFCGSSPANNVRNWMLEGAGKGFAVGAIAGGVTGTVLGTPVGGFFGAIVGGVVDGTVTGGAGVFAGSAASLACSSLGLYH